MTGNSFGGRYKSILIERDSYLLQQVRHIHRKPLKADLVDGIDAYDWSSNKAYISVANKGKRLQKKYIFTLLSKNRKEYLRYYKKWVSVEDEDEVAWEKREEVVPLLKETATAISEELYYGNRRHA